MLANTDNIYKHTYKWGRFAYLILLLFAILFYKERSAYGDSAYHIFHIIKDDKFAIQNYRFGAFFTQLGPLLTSKLGLSLNVVMLSYSSIFILYYYICYVVCGGILKNYKWALVLLVSQLLFVTDTFYSMQSELPQGLAMMMVLFSCVSSYDLNIKQIVPLLVIVVITVTVAFFHPLLVMPFLFIVLFLMLDKYAVRDLKLLISTATLFMITVLVKKYCYSTDYDTNTTWNAITAFKSMGNFWELPSHNRFIKYCIDNYYWIPFSFAITVVTYLIQRKWLKLPLYITSVLGYISLINICYHNVTPTDVYMENLYLSLALILAVPLLFDVLPSVQKPGFVASAVLLVVVLGLVRIYNAHHTYTDRQNWQRKFMKDNPHPKLAVSTTRVPMHILQFFWATPYEFWLLSTTETDKTACIFITDMLENYEKEAIASKHAMFNGWGFVDYNQFPERYFRFTDTASGYRIIK